MTHPEAEVGGATDPGIPEPPWRRRGRTAQPPRQPLTRDAIVGAALEVLDRDGLDAVSMRRVAEQLGTAAGSLYWHVGDKEELLDLLFDRVIGEIEVPPPDAGRWVEQLKEVARAVRRACRAHPGIARVALDRWPVGPNALLFAEGLLGVLRAGGLPDRAAAWLSGLLPSYVGWSALEEQLGRVSPDPGDGADVAAMVADYMASLPAQRFPNVLALAGELAGGDAEERFEFGLDVLVRGITAYAERD